MIGEPASGGAGGAESPARVAAPEPAATVVLLRPSERGPEVLLTRRPATMAFAPDLHVFPGGRVDAEDGDPGLDRDSAEAGEAAAHALGGNLPPPEALAVFRAALRELREEAGVSLSRLDALVPIAHWTTPRFMPRRFSTWFFVADLPPDAAPVFNPAEVVDHRWLRPLDALEQMAAGEIEMWVPTTSVLQRLVETGATRAAEVAENIRMAPTAPPRIVETTPTLVRLAFGAAGGLPGRSAVVALHGVRDLVLVDPGDASDAAIDAIHEVVAGRSASIRAIVLTASDPDHAAGAEAIAIPLEVPILVAPGAGRQLPYPVVEVADGDRLPADVDLRVRLGPGGSGRLAVVSASAGE